MATDLIRYDLMVQDALRGVVRRVLTDVGRFGLPGEHHLYISFKTGHSGVRLSNRLREQYPEEMTIVLQHQFWDLVVTESYLEVGLSFNAITEKLHVPLDAIKGFFDPSVQFGLQFETLTEGVEAKPADKPALAPVAEEPRVAKPRRKAQPEAPAAVGPAEPAKAAPTKPAPPVVVAGTDKDDPDKPSGGAEVVRLDRFRKK